jgi:protein involved in polysaccharide export with SLBB domain
MTPGCGSISALLLAAWSCGLVAAAQQPLTVGSAAETAQRQSPVYRLTAGDLIEFKFTYETTLNDIVMIRPDGRIALTEIGELVAEGMTPQQLSDAVETAYTQSGHVRPDVAVSVREFAALRVYVGGEVNAPSVVPLRGHLTALQAVLASGGPTRSGRLDSVILLRYRDRETTEVRKLDFRKIMSRQAPDVTLHPYDVVYIPLSRIAKVGTFVEQYVNNMIPKAVIFPYNLDQTVVVERAR